MASNAEHGRRLLRSMLPDGMTGPDVTIRRRPAIAGVAYTVRPHPERGRGGEYMETALVPDPEGHARDLGMMHLRTLVGRWIEVERMRLASVEEAAACDGEGDDRVDDDMPVPAWRTHCPEPMRRLLDAAGLAHGARLELGECADPIRIGGARLTVHETCETRAIPGHVGRTRTIRRIAIDAPGVSYAHGVTRCELRLDRVLPESVLSAIVGMPVSALIDLPGLDSPAALVTSVRTGRRTVIEVARRFAMLAPVPGEEG